MAMAKHNAGVRQGYPTKTKRAVKRAPSVWLRAAASFKQSARALREFGRDELVYATMDTVRLLNSLRYELGFRTRTRVEPMVQELEHFVHDHELLHDVGAFGAEQVRVLAKR